MPVGKSGNSGAGGKPGSRPGSRPSGDAGPSTVSGNGDGGRSEAGPGSGASSPDKRAIAYIRRIATQRVSVAENDAFRSRILNDDDFRKLVVQQQELYESRSEHIKARRLKSILGHCDFLRENLPQNPDPRTMMLNELRRGFARLGTSPTQNSRTIAGEESEQLDVIWLVAGDDASPAQARSFDRQFKENLDFQDLASEAQFTLVWKSECEDLVRLGLAMAKSHGLGSQSVILPEHFREGIIEAGVQGVYVATERQGPSSPRTHTRAQTGADSATQPRFSLIGTAPRNAAAHAPQATDRFQRTLAGTIRAIAAARRASSAASLARKTSSGGASQTTTTGGPGGRADPSDAPQAPAEPRKTGPVGVSQPTAASGRATPVAGPSITASPGTCEGSARPSGSTLRPERRQNPAGRRVTSPEGPSNRSGSKLLKEG